MSGIKREEMSSLSPTTSVSDDDTNETTTDASGKKFTVKYKRPRSSRACVTCHDRKVRCDAQLRIPCSNCVSFKCECVLPSSKRVRRTKKEIMAQRAKVPKVDKTEDIMKIASAVDLRKGSPNFKKMIERHANDLLFLGSSAVLSSSKHYKRSMDDTRGPVSDVDVKILELKGCHYLPSVEICHELIDLYFTYAHPFVPVLNASEFIKLYYNDLYSPPSLTLLNTVLLAGSRHSKNPLLLDENGSVDKFSKILYQRVKTFFDIRVLIKPVELVQTLLILGWYWEGPDDVTQNAFYWNRVAITVAQGYGFHKMNHHLSLQQQRIWKRCWWMLFSRDRVTSMAFGRSIVIDLDDCDVPMLTLADFEEEEQSDKYSLSLTQKLYFINYVKLCEIGGIVMKQKYTVQAEKRSDPNHLSFVRKCDLLMINWLNNLPEELQYSLTNPKKQNIYSAMVMGQYYATLSLIHRTNILRRSLLHTSSKDYYPSWGITFQSSHMIAIICKNLMDKGELTRCPAFIVSIIFSALIMLIYHIDNKDAKVRATAKKLLDICLKAVLNASKIYSVGYLCLQLAEILRDDKAKRELVLQNVFQSPARPEDGKAESDFAEQRFDSATAEDHLNFQPSQLFPNLSTPEDVVSVNNITEQQQQTQALPPAAAAAAQLAQAIMPSPAASGSVAHHDSTTLNVPQQLSNLRDSPASGSGYVNSAASSEISGGSAEAYDLPFYNFEVFDSNINSGLNVSRPDVAGGVVGSGSSVGMFQDNNNGGYVNNNNNNSGSSNNNNGETDSLLGEINDPLNQNGAQPPNSLSINDWFNFLQY